ncbi:hypothetical protein [Thioalkalivibrio sp. HK1]|uniref:hypothetical protein n=1 Tax=Thioalkalivibrio sp. HK1 TaxID=1469245 RepID=UPI0004B92FFB|nr:hypothetical protein [Thioalkalivibrio sp. HK1]
MKGIDLERWGYRRRIRRIGRRAPLASHWKNIEIAFDITSWRGHRSPPMDRG